MKNFILTTVMLCFFSTARSQEQPPISVDSMLVNIEKTELTSGVLYDRVTSWARLENFNDTTFVSSVDHFEQALYEMYLASNKEKFMDYKDLREFYSPDNLLNQAEIGIINASFHSVNYVPENVEEGGLRIGDDSLFVKIDNENPAFLEHHVLVAAPLKKYLKVEEGGNIVYHFNSDFLFEDVIEGKQIVRLTANFGTSTNYTLIENGEIVNQEVSVQYNESGPQLLVFTASFANDTEVTAQTGVFISIFVGDEPVNYINDYTIDAEDPFQGYDEPYALKGRLEYRVFYSGPQEKLMKPIIIIDGFDPGDKRKIEDKDSPKPADEHRSILEVMTYDKDGETQDILEDLHDLGYDVVIVNHPTYKVPDPQNPGDSIKIDGGADYIERNAMAHIALYKELNSQLVTNNSNEQLVIVGPSMGGQISRYALAYMEEQYAATDEDEWNHNTRLWVSVDSPHLGANVPMGVQMLLNYAYYRENSVAAGEFVVGMLQSAAARQQMIEQVDVDTIPLPPSSFLPDAWYTFGGDYFDGRTLSQGFSQDKGDPYFIQYYNALYSNGLSNSRGYPQASGLRRIAMANGSLTNSEKFENPFEYLSTELSLPPSDDQYANSPQKTFRVVGRAHFVGDVVTMETYPMPDTGDHHRVSTFGKRSGFLGDFNYHHFDLTNYNSRGCLDNAPGGWYPTQQELAEGVLESSPCEWKFIGYVCVNHWDLQVLEHVSSFIPTVSALGFTSPDFNWHEEFDRNLICPTNPEIPFDNYYGPKINEQHTSFTEESFEWFLDELDGDTNYPEPTVYLDGGNISGPEHLCYGDEGTYSLEACDVPAESWQVSNNLQIISSTDQSVTVKYIDYLANWGAYIQANLPHDVAKRHIQVGNPDVTSTQMTSDGPPYTVNWRTMFQMGVSGNDAEYHWSINFLGSMAGPAGCTSGTARFMANDSTTLVYTINSDSDFITPGAMIKWGNCEATYEIRCEVRNKCGLAGTGVMRVNTELRPGQNPCDPPKILAQITPNPNSGNEDWHVLLEKYPCPPESGGGGDNPNPTEPTPPFIIKIFDIFARERYSNQFETTDFTIRGLYLEPGQYIVNIMSEEGIRGQEIVIVE